MRKGVGLGALTRTSRTAEQYQTHGSAIRSTHIDELTTQFEVFRASLTHFAQAHAKDIRSDPNFRAEFARMCATIGIDPLASSAGRKGGSFWGEIMGGSVGDFYFGLAVRVVEVCRETREENGGLVEVEEVRKRIEKVNKEGGGGEVSTDDVLRAVDALKPLGSGFTVVEIGKQKFIRSVPKELNQDQFTVMEAAQVGKRHCFYIRVSVLICI